MPFSVNDIRQFAGNDRLLFDPRAQGTGLQSVNKWQRFKSFFNIGDARLKNIETLTAIHNAILNDPDFFAQNVREKAWDLLSKVRTDRAISAVQIRDIISQLDAIATPDKRVEAAKDLVGARIAARGLPIAIPPEAAAAYMRLAKDEVVPQAEPPHGYGRFDYASALDAFDARIGAFFTHLGNGRGDAEAAAGFLSTVCTGKDQAALAALGDAFRATFDETRALGAQHGEQARRDAMVVLAVTAKPFVPTQVEPHPLGPIVEAARTLRAPALETLDAQSPVYDIHRALDGFSLAVVRLPAVAAYDGRPEREPALALALQTVLGPMPKAAKENLLAALESEAGKHLVAFCRDESNPEANAFAEVARTAAKLLKHALGRPHPEEGIPLPEHADTARLSASVFTRYGFSADRFLSGNASDSYRGFVDAFVQAHPDDPTAAFRRRTSELAVAKSILAVGEQLALSLDIEKDDQGRRTSATQHTDWCPTFEKDLPRSMHVRFPDGGVIDKTVSLADARTKLLRFVTGDDAATWTPEVPGRAEDPRVVQNKIKVLVLMAFMNQATNLLSMESVFETLAGGRSMLETLPLTGSSPDGRIDDTAFSKDADGNISMHFQSRLFLSHVSNAAKTAMIPLSGESYMDYGMDLTLPAANLDALSRADWTRLDMAEAKWAESNMNPDADSIAAAKLVAPEFRFAGTAEVAARFHLVKA